MVKALVSGPDGRDLFVSSPGAHLDVRAGGVLGADATGPGSAGVDVSEVPFGLVELVVASGAGAGAVHRLEVGRYRCGGPDADVDLPCPGVDLEVRCGGTVVLDDEEVWPVGERRDVQGVDLWLRWCAPPAVGEGRPVRGLPLADVLLDRIAGTVPAPTDPTWELGYDMDAAAGHRDAAGGDDLTAQSVAVPIAQNPLLTVVGESRHALARAVLGRLVAACGPEVLRLTILVPGADADRLAAWSWVRWLPHARTGDERVVRVGVDDEACARLVAEVAPPRSDVLDVVVVDGRVTDPPRIARPGLAVMVIDDGPGHSAGLIVDAAGASARVIDAAAPGGRRIAVDLPDQAWSDRLARALSRVEPERRAPGRLADLVGVEPDDHGEYERRWSEPATTRVPIGWAPGDARPVTIDLRADGPHALIGGTTGSGKSELLLTLVSSLAAANPPEAMTFLLIDYKGGAAFGDCARLPHTVGVVTDLDAGLTARALASLSAEVRRRERLLAEVGATDIETYLSGGRGPLARLVIVVDEFATLAAELPDFVEGLVDIARRGRSLGLHLVLATQRPAGAVSADIRANTSLRISLRVAERADSVDVIGVPDAVRIPEDEPGRALIRVGQNAPVVVQTARVTTSAHAPLTAGVPYVFGRPLPEAGDRSDLERMVEAMRAVADARGVGLPQRPWLPPLPSHVDLEGLADAVAAAGGFRGVDPEDDLVIPFGVEDRPAEQGRVLAGVRLDEGLPLAVVGGARSGRTTTLRTLVASAAQRFDVTDLHVYAIDAGARGLSGLDADPHVGAVVFRDEIDRMERLVARLSDEVERRVQVSATRRWRDVLDQRAADPEHAWPFILLLVDRWDLLVDTSEVDDDRTIVAALERLTAEGGRVGIVVVVTGDRDLLSGRMTSMFPDRLVLRLSDVYDYASLGAPGPAGHGEPGRGWRGTDCVETQVAESGLVGDSPAPSRMPSWARSGSTTHSVSLSSSASRRVAPANGGPFRIEAIPVLLTRDELEQQAQAADVPPGGLLVAVGGDDVRARWIDVDEYGPCALVTGRRRSGRSGVLLSLVESALTSPEPWEVALVVARRSPLADVGDGSPQVHGPFRDDDDAGALRDVVERCPAEGRRLLVVADDLDLMPDGALLDELGRLPGRFRDTGCFFVGAGEAEEIVSAFRGPAPALRRARTGVMLAPQTAEDGEAFGVRLRRGQYGRASAVGAGFLVLDGLAERVQVVRSGLLPDPTG